MSVLSRLPAPMRRSARRVLDRVDKAENLARRMQVNAEITTEITAHSRVVLERIDERLELLDELLTGDLIGVLERHDEFAARFLKSFIGADVDKLTPALADLLNFAESHRGFSAQRSLWFNPPITLSYGPGGVQVGNVNERIVEVPFALSAVGGLETGSRVLDIGGAESNLALSLACLGFATTTLDIRGYPLTHPSLSSVVSAVEEWEGPSEPFAAIFCISTIEHLGLGAYGERVTPADERLDIAAMARFKAWLDHDGVLVLTVPFGEWEVRETERVYDEDHLDELLSGWDVFDRRLIAQTAATTWEPAPTTRAGVALVRARPRRS